VNRRLLVAGLGVLGLVVVAWPGLYLAAGSGIARGTTVRGVDIGGQSRSQAAVTLTKALRADAHQGIPVTAGGVHGVVHPARSGLSFDVDATLAAARARSWNPVHLLRAVTGGEEVRPAVSVDRGRLRAAVDRLADRVDRDRVEGSVRFGRAGAVKQVLPVPGLTLVRRDSVAALVEAYLRAPYLDDGTPVPLPATTSRPEVSRTEVRRAADEVATPATASDLTLVVAGTPVTVTPAALAAALTFAPDGKGGLAPRLDGAALHTAIGEPLAAVETPAVDASFRIRSGTPTVVPARSGREVLPATLSAAVLPALARTGAGRTVTVPLEVSEPEVTTEVAQGLGVVERVATYTTYYPSDFPPRLTNIHRAADLMDHTLVLPGRVFSLNRAVGERTEARGFAAGFIINNGQLEVDLGGGVSQLATTTFNAAYFAGLDLVEHHAHSFYISRYPEGRDATIAWGFKDLRFRNDSGKGVFITTSYTNSSVTVTIYGTKRFRIESVKGPRFDVKPFKVVDDQRPAGTEKGDCVATEGVPGFRVVVTRKFFQDGQQVRTDRLRTKYAPENEVRCAQATGAR
jgi:vancomycin resistance protein YoaR